MTDDIKTQNFKVGKQTLLCKITETLLYEITGIFD